MPPPAKRLKHLYPVVTDDSVLNGLETHRNAIIMATPLSNGELVPSSDTDGRNKLMDAHKPPSIKQIATFGSLYNEGAFAVSEQHDSAPPPPLTPSLFSSVCQSLLLAITQSSTRPSTSATSRPRTS